MGARFDLRVTGVVMPGLSDGELAKLLAQPYPKLKALLVSGDSARLVQRHKIASVHANFLQKPFPVQSLAAKVREVLDQRSAAAAGAGG